jgi:hypothetical protein
MVGLVAPQSQEKPYMAHDNQQLLTAQLFQPTECNPPAEPPSQAPRSHALTLLHSAVKFCSFAVAAMVISTGVIWWARSEENPNASADAFLWLTGQNKTWNEYQNEQDSAGRARMDEKEYDWTQQLFNDAYSNR